jgi:hypothetical protein
VTVIGIPICMQEVFKFGELTDSTCIGDRKRCRAWFRRQMEASARRAGALRSQTWRWCWASPCWSLGVAGAARHGCPP